MRSAVSTLVLPVKNVCHSPRVRTLAGWLQSLGAGNAGTSGRVDPDNTAPLNSAYFRTRWTNPTTASGGMAFQTQPDVVTPFEWWTASVWVRSSMAQTLRCVIAWQSATATLGQPASAMIPVAANTWTRLSFSALAPAGTIRLNFQVQASTGSTVWETNATLDATNLMISNTRFPVGFADGDSLSGKWLGTPGQSPSVAYPESPRIIRNLHPFPRPLPEFSGGVGWSPSGYGAGGVGTYSMAANEGIDPGSYAMKAVWSTAATGGGSSMVSGTTVGFMAQVQGGKSYRPAIWGKINQDSSAIGIQVSFADLTGASVGSAVYQLPGLVKAGVWTRVFSPEAIIAPPTASHVQISFRCINLSGTTAGFTMWADKAMVTEGPTLYPYADGNSPGWRWDVPEGRSSSSGYALAA